MSEDVQPDIEVPMALPAAEARGDLPVKTGRRRTLGMRVRSRGEAFYFLASTGGLRRYGRRFPLTEDGWREAWAAFREEDPDAAARYLTERSRPAEDPARGGGASEAERVPVPAGLDAGWQCVAGGCFGVVLGAAVAGDGLVHDAWTPLVVGLLVALVSFVAVMVGAVVVGVHLAQGTR